MILWLDYFPPRPALFLAPVPHRHCSVLFLFSCAENLVSSMWPNKRGEKTTNKKNETRRGPGESPDSSSVCSGSLLCDASSRRPPLVSAAVSGQLCLFFSKQHNSFLLFYICDIALIFLGWLRDKGGDIWLFRT